VRGGNRDHNPFNGRTPPTHGLSCQKTAMSETVVGEQRTKKGPEKPAYFPMNLAPRIEFCPPYSVTTQRDQIGLRKRLPEGGESAGPAAKELRKKRQDSGPAPKRRQKEVPEEIGAKKKRLKVLRWGPKGAR